MIHISNTPGGIRLAVKVVPGASRDRFLGEWDGRAKIAVAAPPEDGKANKAVCALLAKLLGVHRRDVEVVQGQTSPLKTVLIRGVALEHVRAAVDQALL
ncbi:MAG: DUF167 domain-containing protein [Phycisphaerales bacterium]|nr:DUF167 domain-containing protein [Phycisphaerales bacterium]